MLVGGYVQRKRQGRRLDAGTTAASVETFQLARCAQDSSITCLKSSQVKIMSSAEAHSCKPGGADHEMIESRNEKESCKRLRAHQKNH